MTDRTAEARPVGEPTTPGTPLTRILGSLTDQAIYSAGNFVVLLAAVHMLALGGIAAYNIAYTCITIALFCVRTLVFSPLLLRFSTAEPSVRVAASKRAAGAASMLALAQALCCLTAAAAVSGESRRIAIVAGVMFLPAVLQDAWRYHFFAAGRPWAAAANDATCLLVTVLLLAAASRWADPSVVLLLGAWGGGTAVGAVMGCAQVGAVPSLRAGPSWLREHRHESVPLTASSVVGQGMARLAPASLGPIAGAAALGRLYAAQAMMMPINFVLMAVFTFSVPEAARKLRNGPGHLNRYLISLSGGLAGVVMVFAMVVRFLPARIGELYVGDNWAHGRDILLPLVLTVLGVALATGGWVGLLTHSRPTTVLWGSTVAGTLQVVGSAVGAALAGLTGAAWGMALASVCSAVIWWVLLARTAPTPFPQLPRQSGAGAGVVSRDRGADGQLALHG